MAIARGVAAGARPNVLVGHSYGGNVTAASTTCDTRSPRNLAVVSLAHRSAHDLDDDER
jgi:hypothetical protein